jgi:hypothetical protein
VTCDVCVCVCVCEREREKAFFIGGGEGGSCAGESVTLPFVPLQQGGTFTKFGRRGYPHKRVVAITDDCTRVVWAEPGSGKPRPTSAHESLDIAAITDVVEGVGGSDIFARNARHVKRPDCCLSIITPERSLDLEAETPEVKEQWLTAFMCLRKYGRGI